MNLCIVRNQLYNNNALHIASYIMQLLCITDHATIPLELRYLAELVIPKMAHKWFDMGLQLGMRRAELEIIKSNYDHDCKGACRQMFTEWLNTDTKQSWQKVLIALSSKSVGKKNLAEELAKKYKLS